MDFKNSVDEFKEGENFLLNSNTLDWEKIFEQYLNKIMIYDKDNLSLNKLINDIKQTR